MFKQTRIRELLYLTLALGVFQWLLWTTGYAWDSTLAQYLFPPAVGMVGLETWMRLRTQKSEENVALLPWCLPAILAGLPVLLAGMVLFVGMLFVPFVFFFVPMLMVDGETVGESISPDGNKRAVARYREDIGMSSDSGDSGTVTISMKYRWLPMLRHDVRSYSVSSAERQIKLAWQGNQLMGDGVEMPVNIITLRLPSPFQDYGK